MQRMVLRRFPMPRRKVKKLTPRRTMSVWQKFEERARRRRKITPRRSVRRAKNTRALLRTPQFLAVRPWPWWSLTLLKVARVEGRSRRQGRQQERMSRREGDSPRYSSSHRLPLLQGTSILCNQQLK